MTNKVILPGSTIGILGGGQLGRMLAIESKKMGYNVVCLDPTPNSPCGQVADKQIVADYDDINAATQLADEADVLLYEFENIDSEVVRHLESRYYLPQKSCILEISQDRFKEKENLKKAGFPVVPYEVVTNNEELELAIRILGYPSLLKTTRGGYDGKGQFLIANGSDLEDAKEIIKQSPNEWVLEKKISFVREVSAIVARKETGETAVYPIGENIHRNNILHATIVPARISQEVEKEANELAVSIAGNFEIVGLLAVEFFDTGDGLLINELAPRPHNSGHYTWDACYVSQFEQLIRAVCGLPLGTTELLAPVVMINILGAHFNNIVDNLQNFPDTVKFHLYGKRGSLEAKRKMGHLTIATDKPEEAIAWAEGIMNLQS